MNDKELIVRKVTSSFIEKVFKYCGYDINHNDVKALLYDEECARTNLDEQIKSYFDAYMYLLNNSKSNLSNTLLNKFFFILNKEIDEYLISKMVNSFYYLSEYAPIEKAVEFHLMVRKLLNNDSKLNELIIPLMMLNYVLVKNNIPSIKLSIMKLKEYERVSTKEELLKFFLELIKNYDFISKNYLKKLKPISLKEIIDVFLEDKEMLMNKYSVKTLLIHGSFAKGRERIDSDIDVVVRLNMDLLYEQRINVIKELKEYYTNKFKRFVDIQEANMYLDDAFLKEDNEIKIIINEGEK